MSNDHELKSWKTLRGKLYRIGHEERFKTRIQMLWDYCEPKDDKTVELAFLMEGKRCTMQVSTGAFKASSLEICKIKGVKTYYYINVVEGTWRHKARKKYPEDLIISTRVDDKGKMAELLWLSKGKQIPGKVATKMVHAYYKCLRAGGVFLHDDAHLSFGYAGGPTQDWERTRKRAAQKESRRQSKRRKKAKKKIRFRGKNGLPKKQRICVRSLRTLAKGAAWYESLGFEPCKMQGRLFHKDKESYSQNPLKYKAAISHCRKTTVAELCAMFDKSSECGKSWLCDSLMEICEGLGFKRANVTIGTVAGRLMQQMRRKPKSLKVQRLVAKFNHTILKDHEARFDCPTGKMSKWYDCMTAIELTMLFSKKRVDYS